MDQALRRREVVTSRRNSKIQWIRSLQDKKTRQAENVVVLEGLRLVEDVLSLERIEPRLVVYTERLLASERGRRLLQLMARLWPQTWQDRTVMASDDALAAAAETDTPQGIIAVVPAPWGNWTGFLADLTDPRNGQERRERSVCLLGLDGVSDPGNVGTAIRSACGAGLKGVLVGPGCADPGVGKAVRASMGAMFRVPVFPVADLAGAVRQARDAGFRVFAAAAPKIDVPATALWDVHFSGKVMIVVGSEAAGISDAVAALVHENVTIPLLGGLESLNAGVAASVLAFECARQNRRDG